MRTPTYDLDAAVLDIDLHTGKLVTVDDVVSKADALLALADDCSDVHAAQNANVLDAAGKLAYLFLDRGIKVVGLNYPAYLARVMTFGGPILSYGVLLREGLLKAQSPIARRGPERPPRLPEPRLTSDGTRATSKGERRLAETVSICRTPPSVARRSIRR